MKSTVLNVDAWLVSLLLAVMVAVLPIVHGLNVTLGSQPFCKASEESCLQYGLEMVEKTRAGCISGTKVICEPPYWPQMDNSDPKRLRLVSYRIMNKADGRKGSVERTCRIPRELIKRVLYVDLVVLHDSFSMGCLPTMNMLDLFKSYGLGYHYTPQPNEHSGKEMGIMVISRFPIAASSFKYVTTTDGVVHVSVLKSGHLFNIVATTSIRSDDNQLAYLHADQIYGFVRAKQFEHDRPLILVADFGVDLITQREEVQRLLKSLRFRLPTLLDEALKIYDTEKNSWATEGQSSWEQFVAFSRDHLLPQTASMHATFLEASKEFSYSQGAIAMKTKITKELSKYYPLVAEFGF